jgi:hypothetical protein
MKKYILFAIVPVLVWVIAGCSKFLEKEPLGQATNDNFIQLSPENGELAINAVYDVATWEEGPRVPSQTYEWMFGDVLSDDAEKGSNPADFVFIQDLKDWKGGPDNPISRTIWINNYSGVFRACNVLQTIQKATWDKDKRTRITGEAHFLRGYFYFYLVRLFGGVPLFEEAAKPSQFGTIQRSSVAETYKFIEADFKAAAEMLPEKSGYAAIDLGRATKGAAKAYLARAIMYQMGTDNTNGHTWEEVYNITNEIRQSGEYNLLANYAQIYEEEGENGLESIFELQQNQSPDNWGPIKTGTTNNVIQNCRKTWGWGFNNPTVNLLNEFEPNDPRKACTAYGDQSIVLGVKQTIEFPTENQTGYLNRKAAVEKPAETKSSGQNVRKMRYADVLLMQAEAAARTGKEGEARDILNQIRNRARKSTLPKGGVAEGELNYDPAPTPEGTLPEIQGSVSGQALLDAVAHERRVELGMEAVRFWDLIRYGTYLTKFPAASSHTIQGTVNPIPVLAIPRDEVQTWNLKQNPGY